MRIKKVRDYDKEREKTFGSKFQKLKGEVEQLRARISILEVSLEEVKQSKEKENAIEEQS